MLPGISTVGVKFGWARGTFDTKPSAFKELHRINAIGGVSIENESIDASALVDKVEQSIKGRASAGGSFPVTVNCLDETIAEWEEVFTASETAAAAGETIWFENWNPNRKKAFFYCCQTPDTFPAPEEGQNSLETFELNLILNQYKGAMDGIEPVETVTGA